MKELSSQVGGRPDSSHRLQALARLQDLGQRLARGRRHLDHGAAQRSGARQEGASQVNKRNVAPLCKLSPQGYVKRVRTEGLHP
jgi:hypothetical protein